MLINVALNETNEMFSIFIIGISGVPLPSTLFLTHRGILELICLRHIEERTYER